MVSAGVGVPGGTPKPPRVTPRDRDYPSNYLSATTELSWKAFLVLCAAIGLLIIIALLDISL